MLYNAPIFFQPNGWLVVKSGAKVRKGKYIHKKKAIFLSKVSTFVQ